MGSHGVGVLVAPLEVRVGREGESDGSVDALEHGVGKASGRGGRIDCLGE